MDYSLIGPFFGCLAALYIYDLIGWFVSFVFHELKLTQARRELQSIQDHAD